MAYQLHELQAASGNHGGSRTADQIKYLVVHYTGNDGDTAANNAKYYQSTVVEASAHYFVDNTEVWRSVPDLTVAWAVGGKKYPSAPQTGGGTMHGTVTNTNSISIELCGTARDGSCQASATTLDNAMALCVDLMEKYNIPLENVYRHFDVTGKLCPRYMVDTVKWAEFKSGLRQRAADNIPAPYARDAVRWAKSHDIIAGNTDGDLMLTKPLTRQQFMVMLYRYHQRFYK